jgi:glycerate kinase
MADGGEGTASTLANAQGGEWIEAEVAGPLPGMRVQASWLWLPRGGPGALVEMASASGLALLRPDQLDPMSASSYGTGELIAAALARVPRTRTVVRVLCDVDNPLLGERGASSVFGPQKGAGPDMVERLEAGMANLAEVVAHDLGVDMGALPGAGAAGGMAGGAVAFLGARLVSGVDAVMDACGLDDALRGADWVVTGEGRFDDQSLGGKVFSGVLQRARRCGCRVAVVAGAIDMDARRLADAGVDACEVVTPPAMDLADALARAPELIESAAARLAPSLRAPATS